MVRPVAIACALVLVAAGAASAQEQRETSPPTETSPATEAVAATPPNSGASSDATGPATDGAAETPSEPSENAADGAPGEARTASPTEAPKVAIVVVGDPDPALQAAARRVEQAIGDDLRFPFDPGLRAALRGEAGEHDDGLDEVRSDRRRLSADEAHDAPVLASLGRRAGAAAVGVVRAGVSAPELLVLDVRNAAFYEGTLSLESDASDARISSFVVRRARTSAASVAAPPPAPAAPEAPAAAVADEPAQQPAHQPDFFEQYWPYGVAALLLGAMITAIALTTGGGAGSTQPVLRFEPGGM